MPARPASHLNRLHVWWARRPLTVSRAAIVGGVLPARSADWPAALREQFPTADAYHAWFLRFLGIFGDPTQGRKLLAWTRQEGRFIANPYNYARAFTVNPSAEDLAVMGDLLEYTWGTRDLSVLDPFGAAARSRSRRCVTASRPLPTTGCRRGRVSFRPRNYWQWERSP